MISFEQFARQKKLSLQHVRRIGLENNYRYIEHAGTRYELTQEGTHANGTPRYFIIVQDDARKKKHLSDEQREIVLNDLNAMNAKNESDAIAKVAKKHGVSYWSVYRLWKNPERVQRKARTDRGSTKKIVPTESLEIFQSIYLQNAQGPNARLAYNLMRRQFDGWDLPFRYFKQRGKEIEPLRLRYHQESKFEQKYTPRMRRDLWSEFEFLEQVSLDGWTVPDRVLKSWGFDDLTKKKFKFNGKDVSMVCVFAFDSKTRYPLAWRAFEKSVSQDDVLAVLLDVVYRWGRPSTWLLDNGTEFTNDAVQRFLRGLYTTADNEAKNRIIFSEPYQPYGKGAHERQHRIFKDEFCAFSRSYSPSQSESRKPTLQLSAVKPTHTLAQWVESFEVYLNGYYREAQRISWMNPDYKPQHEENANRPRTLNEALDRAYKSFTPVKIDPMKLAFLYAKKFKTKIKQGSFSTPAAISAKKIVYLPEGEGISCERYSETFEVVVNPANMWQAWICDLNNNLICEAWDPRGKNRVDAPTRENASAYKKTRNLQKKRAKEAAVLSLELVKMEDMYKRKSAATREQIAVNNIEKSIFAELPVQNDHYGASMDDEDFMKSVDNIYDEIFNPKQTTDEESNHESWLSEDINTKRNP
jgi:transposase InsO family protein